MVLPEGAPSDLAKLTSVLVSFPVRVAMIQHRSERRMCRHEAATAAQNDTRNSGLT